MSLEVPDELELSWMKGQGKQAAEELLPETPDDFQGAPSIHPPSRSTIFSAHKRHVQS